ncbi:hypothetical protein BDM02DRAFT_321879 [Thelephora ganbajun]|uniref:Uncharacterized protein n=1 Tax=Thelephora ganbajun TaxID=370292 RepID=A0ACB6ZQD8_THEGA|nr:hypothetical protein BDM02DRAFT_321879 [Thelephora ganbajun]
MSRKSEQCGAPWASVGFVIQAWTSANILLAVYPLSTNLERHRDCHLQSPESLREAVVESYRTDPEFTLFGWNISALHRHDETSKNCELMVGACGNLTYGKAFSTEYPLSASPPGRCHSDDYLYFSLPVSFSRIKQAAVLVTLPYSSVPFLVDPPGMHLFVRFLAFCHWTYSRKRGPRWLEVQLRSLLVRVFWAMAAGLNSDKFIQTNRPRRPSPSSDKQRSALFRLSLVFCTPSANWIS